MRKYRIVEHTFADGSKRFGPQVKFLFIWWSLYQEAWFSDRGYAVEAIETHKQRHLSNKLVSTKIEEL